VARVWGRRSAAQRVSLRGHDGLVLSVAVTPDGEEVITGGSDGTTRIWDRATGAERLRFFDNNPVWAVAVTPDGAEVLTCGGNNARIRNRATGDERVILTGHTGPIWAVAITPNGREIITGGADNTIRVWGRDNGQQVRGSTQSELEEIVRALAPEAIVRERIAAADANRRLDLAGLEIPVLPSELGQLSGKDRARLCRRFARRSTQALCDRQRPMMIARERDEGGISLHARREGAPRPARSVIWPRLRAPTLTWCPRRRGRVRKATATGSRRRNSISLVSDAASSSRRCRGRLCTCATCSVPAARRIGWSARRSRCRVGSAGASSGLSGTSIMRRVLQGRGCAMRSSRRACRTAMGRSAAAPSARLEAARHAFGPRARKGLHHASRDTRRRRATPAAVRRWPSRHYRRMSRSSTGCTEA